MVLNIGYIELGGTDVFARVYYDTAWLDTDPTRDPADAPLINGPRGWCLDMVNRTGEKATLTITGIKNNPQTIQIAQGDPVTSGPAAGRSRTAAQLASLGFTTRGNVGTIQIG
jgi:hypothetical protein